MKEIEDYYEESKNLEEYYKEKKMFCFNYTKGKRFEKMKFGERLSLFSGKRRVGIDFTLGASKSMSLAGILLGERGVEEAFLKGVERLTQEINKDLEVVKRQGGIREKVSATGVFSVFLHELSREKEPHLHGHVILHNVVELGDGVFCAVENSILFKKKTYYDLLVQYEMGYLLQRADYGIYFKRENVELAGIPEVLSRLFSSRRAQIEAFARERGLSIEELSHSARRAIAYITRREKEKVEHDELYDFWMEQIREAGINLSEINLKSSFSRELNDMEILEAVMNSFKKLHEQNSLIQDWVLEKQVVKELMYRVNEENIKLISLDKLRKKVAEVLEYLQSKGRLQVRQEGNQRFFCLSEVVSEEAMMLELARGLKEREWELHRFSLKLFSDVMERYEREKGFKLTREQIEGAVSVLSPSSCIVLLEGHAGTGKTTLYEVVKEYAGVKRIPVIGLAPTGKAAEELAQSLGQGATVDSFLVAWENERKRERIVRRLKNGLIIIDEAGMLGVYKAKKLLDVARKLNAKIVFSGDRKQFQSIERGAVLRDLQSIGIKKASLYQIRRQKEANYLEITRSLSEKDFETAYRKIWEKRDKWREIKDFEEAISEIESSFRRKKDLVVVSTNALKDRINERIRKRLGIQDEIIAEVYTTKNVNPERINDVSMYSVGDILKLRGLYLEVIGIDDKRNAIRVRTEKGKIKEMKASEINLKELQEVFRKTERAFGCGEIVMALRNDKEAGLKNGQMLEVVRIEGNKLYTKDLKRERSYVIDLNKYRYLDWSYAVTSYKSQGTTVDRVIFLHDGTTNFHEFYVALTRGRQDWRIYTPSLVKLFSQAQKIKEKRTTTSDAEISFTQGEIYWWKRIKKWEEELKMNSEVDYRVESRVDKNRRPVHVQEFWKEKKEEREEEFEYEILMR